MENGTLGENPFYNQDNGVRENPLFTQETEKQYPFYNQENDGNSRYDHGDLVPIDSESIGGKQRKHGGYYWYALILSRYAVLVLVLTLLVSIGCVVVVFVIHGFPTFDPSAGVESRGTTIKSRALSTQSFFQSFQVGYPTYYLQTGDTSNSTKRRKKRQEQDGYPTYYQQTGDNNGDKRRKRRQVNEDGTSIGQAIFSSNLGDYGRLMFEAAKDGDLFTTDRIKAMCEAEQELYLSHPMFSLVKCYYCPDYRNLGTFVLLLNQKNNVSCNGITDNDVANAKQILHRCAKYYTDGSLRQLPCNDTIPIECCAASDTVSSILFFLAEGEFARVIADDPNAKLRYATHVLPASLYYLENEEPLKEIYLDRFHRKSYQNDQVTLRAVDFGGEIKFAVFNSFLFRDFAFLAIGLFSVIFVLWVYTQSLLIAIATFVVFILSFLLSFFLYFVVFRRPFFPFVNAISIVMLLGIGADDTFVYFDLWRKSLKDNKGADLQFLVQETLHHATITMLVTSVTTAGSLYASIISDITMIKCLGLFAGTSIMVNFLLTLTLLPAVIIIQYRMTTWYNNKFGQDTDSKFSRYCDLMGRLRTLCLKPLHVFFKKIIPVVILKLRYVWIILFGALGIGGALVVFKYPGLQLPSTESFQVLEFDSLLEQWDLTYKDKFAFSGLNLRRMTNFVIFGVKAVDNGNHWDPEDRGSLVFDDSFQFSTSEHQEWMLALCKDLRQQDFYNDENSNCFMESLIEYMDRPCGNFPGQDVSPCCNVNTFPYEKSVLDKCLRECFEQGPCDHSFCIWPWYGVCSSFQFHPDDNRLLAVSLRFSSSIYDTIIFETIRTYWGTANKWVTEKIADAPIGLKGGWFISEVEFYDLQRSLGYGTPIALGVTFIIVLIILLCTILNIVIALFAVLAVAFAVFVTIATLVLLEWELNVFESVILIMAIGLCVDFTIHYGVAYRLAPKTYTKRSQRTKFTIHTMLGAITVAALSTFLAGVFMLAANVNAYLQLGLFLTLVMSVSWSFSSFFFLSLCRTLGPQSSFGDLTSIGWCVSIYKKCTEHKVRGDKNEHDSKPLPIPPSPENRSQYGGDVDMSRNRYNGDIDISASSRSHLPDMQSYHNAMFDDELDLAPSSVKSTVKAVRNPGHRRIQRSPWPNHRPIPSSTVHAIGSVSRSAYQTRPGRSVGNGTINTVSSAQTTTSMRTVFNPGHKHYKRPMTSYYVGRR